jgi:hypothetical protein
MKVYITHYEDGVAGMSSVDKAFSSLDKACQYVIKRNFLRNDFYKNYSDDELMKAAEGFVEIVDVE